MHRGKRASRPARKRHFQNSRYEKNEQAAIFLTPTPAQKEAICMTSCKIRAFWEKPWNAWFAGAAQPG
jgi:hypothetical protein